jgi:hypothetical protein
MDKYTFIEFIATQEGDNFNVIEGAEYNTKQNENR